MLIPPLALGIGLGAWLLPTFTIFACLISASLYNGIYLAYRVELFGVPLAPFDLVPILLLVAAFSLRRTLPGRAPAPNRLLLAAVVLFGAGLAIGAALGVAEGAGGYEMVRVARVEVALLAGLVAAMIAGHAPGWRRTVSRGLYAAGVLVAIQMLATFFSTLLTGQPVWSYFPFGYSVADVDSALAAGEVAVLRSNGIPMFLILPAFCMASLRGTPLDQVVIGLTGAAALVSVSRTIWAAFVVAALGVLLLRALEERFVVRTILGWAAIAAPVAVVAFSVAGDVFERRFDDFVGSNALQDKGAQLRKSETTAALRALTRDSDSFALGTGAGVIIPHPFLATAGRSRISSILENQLLARWTNLTILSLLACVLLSLAAWRRGWRDFLRGQALDPPLSGATVVLPVIVLAGFAGGTLLSAQITLPFWLLAGTVLAGSARGAGPSTGD